MKSNLLKSTAFFAAPSALPNVHSAARRRAGAMLITAALMAAAPTLTFGATNVPLEDPIPGVITASVVTVDLKTIATGIIAPVTGAVAPGDENHIYVADQVGKLYRIQVGENKSAGTPIWVCRVYPCSACLL